MPPNGLEGLFLSIAAMAMMGRAMNKLRPGALQKRGIFGSVEDTGVVTVEKVCSSLFYALAI
jgi:hypothetical protein